MIERVYLRDFLSLKEVDICLEKGLVTFTGASGAGKSLFMNSLLTLFGLKESEVGLVEVTFNAKIPNLEEYGISNEEPNTLKLIRQKNTRYFINSQSISKKNMQEIAREVIRYLSLKDTNELSSNSLLELIDALVSSKDNTHQEKIDQYKKLFLEFIDAQDKLKKIEAQEKNIAELREFATYEIENIKRVNPKEGEDEELMNLKKTLSKKEKLQEAIGMASGIFEYESKVSEVLELSGVESSFFDECMNELRAVMDEGESRLEALDELDIESLLERIEQISKLKTRYGSIEEILAYKEKREKELVRYENISFEKQHLKEQYEILEKEIQILSKNITKGRKSALKELEDIINSYLDRLYLNNGTLKLGACELCELGADTLQIHLSGVDIKKISSGEMNRLRLAFIATKNELVSFKEGGVLLLDEVDANVSGKEAMSVAKVLQELAKNYQVLSISHQPQLSSMANQHFLVEKKESISTISLLDANTRAKELARMISGENIEEEALEFATKLLEQADVKRVEQT